MIHVIEHTLSGVDTSAMTRAEAVNCACEYLMDIYYPEHGEDEVIAGYSTEYIQVLLECTVIQVKNICKTVVIH